MKAMAKLVVLCPEGKLELPYGMTSKVLLSQPSGPPGNPPGQVRGVAKSRLEGRGRSTIFLIMMRMIPAEQKAAIMARPYARVFLLMARKRRTGIWI